MAKIKSMVTGVESPLFTCHFFGRHVDHPYTQVKGDNISRQHALITWDGRQWLLDDTSTNGTFLNKRPVERQKKHPLTLGDEISFGGYEAWSLIDTSRPNCMLVPLQSHESIIDLDPAHPSISIDNKCLVVASGTGDWIFKTNDEFVVLKHGLYVGEGDNKWIYIDAKPQSNTFKITGVIESNSTGQNTVDLSSNTNESEIESSACETVFNLEVLKKSSLNISLFLYCCGMARQTTSTRTSSVIKSFCNKEGVHNPETIDVKMWRLWFSPEVNPRQDKLESFCEHLIKQFPVISQWYLAHSEVPSSPSAAHKKLAMLIEVESFLKAKPQQAIKIWRQQAGCARYPLKANALHNAAKDKDEYQWLEQAQEWLCDVQYEV